MMKKIETYLGDLEKRACPENYPSQPQQPLCAFDWIKESNPLSIDRLKQRSDS